MYAYITFSQMVPHNPPQTFVFSNVTSVGWRKKGTAYKRFREIISCPLIYIINKYLYIVHVFTLFIYYIYFWIWILTVSQFEKSESVVGSWLFSTSLKRSNTNSKQPRKKGKNVLVSSLTDTTKEPVACICKSVK